MKRAETYSPGGEEERGRRLRRETGGSQQAAPLRKGQRFRQGSAPPDLPIYDSDSGDDDDDDVAGVVEADPEGGGGAQVLQPDGDPGPAEQQEPSV